MGMVRWIYEAIVFGVVEAVGMDLIDSCIAVIVVGFGLYGIYYFLRCKACGLYREKYSGFVPKERIIVRG